MRETISSTAGSSLFLVGGRSREDFRIGLSDTSFVHCFEVINLSFWNLTLRLCSYLAVFSHFRVPGKQGHGTDWP